MKIEESLLFFTFSNHPIGYSKTHEDGDAATQRGRLVVVGSMRWQQRRGHVSTACVFGVEVDVARLAVFGIVATVEETAVGEGGQGEAEEDGYG